MSLREQLQQTLAGSYRLERELGGGGMSRVFLAEEIALGRRVVVKVLPPEVAASVNADRFKREIQVAARLQHPHIVPVLSAGEMQGIPYYTMPFVEGESVRARLARGPLAITETIGILRDVAKALAYAHEHGIVHRDIKPDNVLLSGGSATVTDFGIAKAIAAARSQGDVDRPETLTQIGSSIGTPAYMAPEQAAADPSTGHRADIYAFGCTAYELLTGRPPFVEKSPQRLLAAHMGDAPRPITALRADVPPALAELVMRCLEKDQDARPQHAALLVQVLETVTSGGGHPSMPSVLLGGRGMLAKALGAYVAAFVFVAVLARAAIVAVGLPDWVFPGALIVMALGLPVILFTAYVHHTTRRLAIQSPTYTPGGSPAATHGTIATLAVRASPHVSWRRTWMGGVLAVGTFVGLIGVYMTLRAMGIGPFGSLMAAGAFQHNEKLLVADFNSSLADSSIAPVVTDAFRTALGQSRSVTVAEPNELREVLRRMQRPPNAPIDFAVAREIASREGMKAVVVGDVIGIGGNFAISVRLLSAQTAEELARFRVTARGEDELLPAIDDLAKDLRARIGESLKSVQATPALERVTTPSLEALKKYVQGSRILAEGGAFRRGAELLEEAISLDTAFAMAYRRLAVEYSNRQQEDKSLSLLQKAYEYRDRLSDAERYLVLGSYYHRGPQQDLAKSASAYETLLELQPDNYTALNNVAISHRWVRNWVKAEDVLRRSIATGYAPMVTYNQLLWVLWNQGKREEAWRHLAVYDSLFPHNPQRFARRLELLYSSRQFDSAEAVATRVLASDVLEPLDRAYTLESIALAERTRGRLAAARRYSQESIRLAAQNGRPQARLEAAADLAMEYAVLLENRTRAVAELDAALSATPIESLPAAVRPYMLIVLAYSMAFQPARAEAIFAAFEASRRGMVRYQDEVERNTMRGAIALASGRYDEAARHFRASSEVGDCITCGVSLLGLSYDRAGMADSAIAVYKRYLETPDVYRYAPDQLFLALTHKGLGELYEAKGDIENAYRNYAAFIELWKNADPELQPKVDEVRRRIAKFKDTETALRSQ